MDLYGDLPPAQGADQSQSSVSISSNFGAIPSAAQKVKLVSVVKNTPKVSSTLAFRPRQAVPKNGIVAIPAKQTELKSGAQLLAQSLDVVSEIFTEPPQQQEVSNTTEEFNTNSSYEVNEAYDPKRPNDYIAYCEERLERRKQMRLQEENRKHMQAAEEARTLLEQERRDAASRGDYQSLLSSAGVHAAVADNVGGGGGGIGVSMGRGRGRGVANLPAWMTQQMAAATPITTAATEDNNYPRLSSSDETAAGQFSDAAPVQPVVVGVKRKQLGMFSRPSCVVLLKNMVALEEVDDQLGAETTQECLKYGPVHSCLIYTEPRRQDQ